MWKHEDVDPFSDDPQPEIAVVRAGEDLDWEIVESFLRDSLPQEIDTAGKFDVHQFPNGAANLTYLVSFGSTELVLRRPPFGNLAPGAHDMGREYKVLSKLWKIFPMAPRAYLFCDDVTIAGAAMFVMERRVGEVIRGIVPRSMRHHDRLGDRIGRASVSYTHLTLPTKRIV